MTIRPMFAWYDFWFGLRISFAKKREPGVSCPVYQPDERVAPPVMSEQFKREQRYVVFKIKDIRDYLSMAQTEALQRIEEIIATSRREEIERPLRERIKQLEVQLEELQYEHDQREYDRAHR